MSGSSPVTIGLVEDDPDQADLATHWLQAAGYRCVHYASAADFRRGRGRHAADLLLLDWELPDSDGVTLLNEVRSDSATGGTPIIMLTVRADEDDIVHALRAGADDYIVKPPTRGVLLARIQAVLRRTQLSPGIDDIDFAPYEFDSDRARVLIQGEDADLTQREFELALYLFRRHGRIIRRETLLESVWQIAASVPTRTVDTHISRLRRKLKLDGIHGWRLVAVYQHGYRLERHGAGTPSTTEA